MGGRKDTKILSFPSVLMRLVGKVPLPLLHALGSVLGWLTYGISPTYRRNLKTNLALAGYTEAAVAYCLSHPRWRLSLQTHKLIGIP